jgi:hypothetical protein
MLEVKSIISSLAVILAFLGYIPYLRDTLKGKTRPHIYSWFIWGFLGAILFALQISAGAGVGTWSLLTVTLLSFFIFFLGLKNGKKDIAKTDTLFFVLAILVLGLWLLAKQPVLSAILITLIDMFGFLPTIRKSWKAPYSETLSIYQIGIFRHGLSILALERYNTITLLNPAVWLLADIFFSIMLMARRKKE